MSADPSAALSAEVHFALSRARLRGSGDSASIPGGRLGIALPRGTIRGYTSAPTSAPSWARGCHAVRPAPPVAGGVAGQRYGRGCMGFSTYLPSMRVRGDEGMGSSGAGGGVSDAVVAPDTASWAAGTHVPLAEEGVSHTSVVAARAR